MVDIRDTYLVGKEAVLSSGLHSLEFPQYALKVAAKSQNNNYIHNDRE